MRFAGIASTIRFEQNWFLNMSSIRIDFVLLAIVLNIDDRG